MSYYKSLIEDSESTPITEKESEHFKEGRSEGAPYLFYDYEEFCDLMGHKITYYPTGVLLSLKDNCKFFETSKSFVFYNNDKKTVLDIHNLNYKYNALSRTRDYAEPTKDIDVKVYEDYLLVTETDFANQTTVEYLVDVHTGEKITDLIDGEQLSFNL